MTDGSLKVRCLGCHRSDFDTAAEGAMHTVRLGTQADDVVVTMIVFVCEYCRATAPRPEAAFITAVQFVAAYANRAMLIT